MLTLLVPLKAHKDITDTYIFRQLLESTLESCQNVPDTKIIVVCQNNLLVRKDPQITILEIGLTGLDYGDTDKGYKIFQGAKVWLETATENDHLMVLDCDDLVSNKIASVCKPGISAAFEKGWLEVWGRYYLQDAFFWRNGSSHLFCYNYIKQAVKRQTDDWGTFLFHQGINYATYSFERVYTPLVIQRTGHGENCYYQKKTPFKNLLKYFLSKAVSKKEFGIGCS
jgi:hypothetical protein